MIYTDIAKAFDRICHKRLLAKLDYYGLSTDFIKLIANYLSDRSQYVFINNFKSHTYKSTSGVPQGSNLGPLLFLIFFNDVTTVIEHAECLLYADDLKLFQSINSQFNSQELQRDVSNVNRWCRINCLELNVNKCFIVSFTKNINVINFDYVIEGSIINRKNSIKDLGVIFDEHLTFNDHISNVCRSATKLLGFIIRNTKSFQSCKSLDILYQSIVRSKAEYASIIRSPFYDKYIYNLETIQSRYLKCKFFREAGYYLNHAREFLTCYYEIQTLEKRRISICVLHLHGLIHNYIDNSVILNKICFRVPRSVNSRIGDTFYCSSSRTNVQLNSPLFRMLSTYNKFSSNIDIFNLNRELFKRELNRLLQ